MGDKSKNYFNKKNVTLAMLKYLNNNITIVILSHTDHAIYNAIIMDSSLKLKWHVQLNQNLMTPTPKISQHILRACKRTANNFTLDGGENVSNQFVNKFVSTCPSFRKITNFLNCKEPKIHQKVKN